MKNDDKDIESSCLMYFDGNNFYGWAMSQKLPVNNFKWAKKLSKFNEHFIKNYDENSDKRFFLEVNVEYLKNSNLPFLPERKKIKKCNKIVCTIQVFCTKKLCCA